MSVGTQHTWYLKHDRLDQKLLVNAAKPPKNTVMPPQMMAAPTKMPITSFWEYSAFYVEDALKNITLLEVINRIFVFFDL